MQKTTAVQDERKPESWIEAMIANLYGEVLADVMIHTVRRDSAPLYWYEHVCEVHKWLGMPMASHTGGLIDEPTSVRFSGRVLYDIYQAVCSVVEYQTKPDRDAILARRRVISESRPPIADDASAEAQEAWMSSEAYKDWHKRLKAFDAEVNPEWDRIKDKGCEFAFAITLGWLFVLWNDCQSVLERAFLMGLIAYGDHGTLGLGRCGVMKAQYEIGPYHVDFAYPDASIAIELDGHAYHERTREQAVSDRERDRYLTERGWRVVRFHYDEVAKNLSDCIEQIDRMVDKSRYRSDELRPNVQR